MKYQVHVHNQWDDLDWSEQVTAAAHEAAVHLEKPEGALTILLTDDDTLRRLNQEFRSIDRTTDVLSFPDGEPDPESGRPYYGDVAISVPQAKRQAEQRGHPLLAELRLLAVHGVLHLFGFDHQEEGGKAAMWDLQSKILSDLGNEITAPSQ